MIKKQIFLIYLIPLFTWAQVPQATDSIVHPLTETVVEHVLTEQDLVQDSINSTLIPISNEDLQPKEFQENFRSKYASSEFQYDVKKESGLIAKLREWWRNFWKLFETDNTSSKKVIDEIVNIIIAFGILIGLGFLIYYLNKKGFIRLFAKKEEQIINEKYIEENIDKIDFETLVNVAKQEPNLRKTIRYYYLWMLKNWSQNEFIKYEPNKTTKQYLNELENVSHKTSFQYISYIYDNIWYGYHEISEADFVKIEQHFIQLINKKA